MSKYEFDSYISNGIILWGKPVSDVLEEGQLRIRQTMDSSMTPLVSILIEGERRDNHSLRANLDITLELGPPNSGKSALAAHVALLSKFPYLKFCTAQTMIGYSELAKCQELKKIFEDAHKSTLSCEHVHSFSHRNVHLPPHMLRCCGGRAGNAPGIRPRRSAILERRSANVEIALQTSATERTETVHHRHDIAPRYSRSARFTGIVLTVHPSGQHEQR